MAKERSELSFGVVVHAIIAGTVAVALAAFEWLTHAVEHKPAWMPALALAIVFVLVFWLVSRFAVYLERMQTKLSSALAIKIRNAQGSVDGYWVDAIYEGDTGQLVSGSILRVTSNEQEGFRIVGHSYDTDVTAEVGNFIGVGFGDDSGIVYKYTGYEGALQRDQGIGHYEFQTNPADSTEVNFNGAFLQLSLQNARYVRGRKIRKLEEVRFTRDGGKTILREYLQQSARQVPVPK